MQTKWGNTMRHYSLKEKAAVKRELRNCARVTGNPHLFSPSVIEKAWAIMQSASKQKIYLQPRPYQSASEAYLKHF